MLSLVAQIFYLTLIPAGLVLGSTPERLAVLAVAAVLLARMVARRRSGSTVRARQLRPAAGTRLQVMALPSDRR